MLALMNPDIHLENKQRALTVVDTPLYADEIKGRVNAAYKSVLSALHFTMVS